MARTKQTARKATLAVTPATATTATKATIPRATVRRQASIQWTNLHPKQPPISLTTFVEMKDKDYVSVIEMNEGDWYTYLVYFHKLHIHTDKTVYYGYTKGPRGKKTPVHFDIKFVHNVHVVGS